MEGWRESTIGDLCRVIAGQSPKGEFYNDAGRGLPFYQGKKQFREKYIGTPRKWTTQVTREAHAGDILMSVRAPVGPVNFATDTICIGRGLAAIRAGERIDREFLFYGLLCIQERIRGSEGAVFASINKKQIQGLPFAAPPLADQERVVAVLDEAFEAIATATANTKRNLDNAREVFESQRLNAFTKTAQAWERQPLGEVCENLDRMRVPITKSKRAPGDVPYYGASGVVDHVADYLFDEDLLLVSEDGANLLARTYPIAFSISGKTWVNNHAHVLRFETEAQREFVEGYLNSISLVEWVSGMAQPKLNQRALNSIPVPWAADPCSMVALTSSLKTVAEETKRLAGSANQKLALLDALKQSTLNKAFSGELTQLGRELSDAGV